MTTTVDVNINVVIIEASLSDMSRVTRVGWQINHLDLAPRYAGVLVGITMTAGTLAGVINPVVVATLVEHQVRVLKPRLHQGNMLSGNMLPATCCLLPSTKLFPVCCPSVAGYRVIQVDRDINE